MIVKSTLKYARMSPRKARRITNVIKGLTAEDAIKILNFMPHKAAPVISKILRSAIANAEDRNLEEPESLSIKEAFVDGGSTMKRIMPRAMRRANLIKKRTSHITIVLSDEVE